MKILIAIQLGNQLVNQIITRKIFCKLLNNYLNLKTSKGRKLNHAMAVVRGKSPAIIQALAMVETLAMVGTPAALTSKALVKGKPQNQKNFELIFFNNFIKKILSKKKIKIKKM